MHTVSTAVVATHFVQFEVIRAAIGIAVISQYLAWAEEIQSGREPEQVEYGENKIWQDWEYYERLYFSYYLCCHLKFSKL